MSDSFLEAFYHFVWATKKREPLITAELEPGLHGYIHQKCAALNVTVHALNGMADHVHLACTLPTTLAIADFMEAIKGGSSHYANHLPGQPHCLYWQRGYGGLTFAEHDLKRIVTYIDNQKTRHREGRLSLKMERTQLKPDTL
jgi:putative transposase